MNRQDDRVRIDDHIDVQVDGFEFKSPFTLNERGGTFPFTNQFKQRKRLAAAAKNLIAGEADGQRGELDGGLYVRSARRMLTRCLLAEDVCTSPVSKKLRFSLRKPLHALVCENACASSRTITLHILPIENRRILLPGNADASCVRDVRCISFRRDTPYRNRNLTRIPEPASCSSSSNARSVGEFKESSRSCQAECDARAKKICGSSDRCAGHFP